MAEPATSESSPETDREFDPSADMMVHEYDDEQTLEEEEALSGDSCCGNELDDLKEEGDMPLDDLLAMYGYGEPHDTRSSSEEEILSNQDLTLDKEEIARDLLIDEEHDKETTVNDLLDSVEVPSHTVRLLRSNSQGSSSDDDDAEDVDYEPVKEEEWKKTIQVGHSFQAVVPEGLCRYGDAPAYENEDRLLWDPSVVVDKEVEKYLGEVHSRNLASSQGVASIPIGSHTRDDEQALYLLLQCGHNVEEALRRRKMQAVPPSDPMSLWSEEECRNFENGLRAYGKDFHLIQQNKVRTRSVGELVQFYYLWKKTERHDVFANKNRLEKKKYSLHPGITDYMDRFLEDPENQNQSRDRSSSPNLNMLIYGDHKRLHNQHDINMDPLQEIKIDPELNTAVPTTISINPAGMRAGLHNNENIVHIASVTTGIIHQMEDKLEPSPKRLKTDSSENTATSLNDYIPKSEPLPSDGHLGNVELSISSVNSECSITDSNRNSINSEPVSRAPVESVAQ